MRAADIITLAARALHQYDRERRAEDDGPGPDWAHLSAVEREQYRQRVRIVLRAIVLAIGGDGDGR